MITVGDICCIKHMAQVKADAFDIIEKWHNDFKSEYTNEVYNYYMPGKTPEILDGAYNYTIEGIVNQDGTLYAICYAHGVERVYVTTLDNLGNPINPRKPFEVGQLVTVTKPLRCYSIWRTLINSLDGQIEDYQNVRSRWTYGRLLDGGGVYKVVYIGRKIGEPEEGFVAVIDDGSKAFIIGTEGISQTYAWEEYRQYLRNWAAKYTEYTPGHSPKTYEQWVQAINGEI